MEETNEINDGGGDHSCSAEKGREENDDVKVNRHCVDNDEDGGETSVM